jgi:hypothetical protein
LDVTINNVTRVKPRVDRTDLPFALQHSFLSFARLVLEIAVDLHQREMLEVVLLPVVDLGARHSMC